MRKREGREREEREKRTEITREEGEISGEKQLEIFLFFLQYCYSAILPLELHRSSIAKKIAILGFCIP